MLIQAVLDFDLYKLVLLSVARSFHLIRRLLRRHSFVVDYRCLRFFSRRLANALKRKDDMRTFEPGRAHSWPINNICWFAFRWRSHPGSSPTTRRNWRHFAFRKLRPSLLMYELYCPYFYFIYNDLEFHE
ncbi:hypothetical protein SCHPADRAFT_636228 [Schizopora paradoxa]|uniref:Uncharacterized protein n=1 Tax=Schizopora paradoxa TaxID=27342 RepID=A0A0H2RSC3_9AGAM|nr:hypothetical protein SCHPADRAFT_636228 [Schizopora paradoxa]